MPTLSAIQESAGDSEKILVDHPNVAGSLQALGNVNYYQAHLPTLSRYGKDPWRFGKKLLVWIIRRSRDACKLCRTVYFPGPL